MSKIETVARTTKEVRSVRSICAMCGKRVKHVVEVNTHTMCTPCFSDYIEDRVGERKIRIEKIKVRNRNAQNPETRIKQTSVPGKFALEKCTSR